MQLIMCRVLLRLGLVYIIRVEVNVAIHLVLCFYGLWRSLISSEEILFCTPLGPIVDKCPVVVTM